MFSPKTFSFTVMALHVLLCSSLDVQPIKYATPAQDKIIRECLDGRRDYNAKVILNEQEQLDLANSNMVEAHPRNR